MLNLKSKSLSNPELRSLQLFRGQQHEPFHWQGGQPAALFIHGFMGTPSELRPLASELHQTGWSVYGFLLPGFGAQIDTLFVRNWTEWTDAARQVIVELQMQHGPILLVGYSMGAAVAINVAAKETAVDGLVLIAPFWHLGNDVQRVIWQVFKRLVPHLQLFKKANFNDPRINEFFSKTILELDLENLQVQHTLRQLRIPTRFVDQVIDLGRAAEQAATDILLPTHIVQGIEDEAVTSKLTRQLLQQFPGPVSYEELVADHELIDPGNRGFNQMTRSVLTFAERLAFAEIHNL